MHLKCFKPELSPEKEPRVFGSPGWMQMRGNTGCTRDLRDRADGEFEIQDVS